MIGLIEGNLWLDHTDRGGNNEYLKNKERAFLRQRKEDSGEHPATLLRTLIDEQEREVDELQLLGMHDPSDPDKSFQAYVDSAAFGMMPNEFRAWSSILSDEEDLYSRTKGEVFARLAYYAALKRNFPGAVVLSPERTLRLYARMNPDAKYLPFPFADTLENVAVPDNVLVNPYSTLPRVFALLEHRTQLTEQSMRTKYENYHDGLHHIKNLQYPGKRIFVPHPRIQFTTPLDPDKKMTHFLRMHGNTDHIKFLDSSTVLRFARRAFDMASHVA